MKLIYQDLDGEIVAMGFMVNPVVAPGNTIVFYGGDFVNPLYDYKYESGVIRAKTDLEKDQVYWCRLFNSDLAIAEINSNLSVTDLVKLSPYLAMVKSYMDYPAPLRNFAQMKLVLQQMITDTILTQDQYDMMSAVVLEQGIDLTLY